MTISVLRLMPLPVLAIVASCGSLIVSKPASGVAEGLPYNLPIGAVRVSLEAVADDKGFKHLKLETGTELHADPAAAFVITTDRNMLNSQEHTVKTDKGMLTLVSTENTNRLLDVVAALATTVVNVVAFGASGGLQALSEDEVDREEILELYKTIAPGQHSVVLLGQTTRQIEVPGTAGYLLFSVEVPTAAAPVAMPSDEYKGVYARPLRPVTATISLTVKWKPMLMARLVRLQQELADGDALLGAITSLNGRIAAASSDAEKKPLIAERDTLVKRREVFLGQRARLENRIGSTGNLLAGASDADRREVAVSEVVVLVPDTTRLVKVPIADAYLGTTKNKVVLVSGVFTEYESSYPSTALELVKIPLRISESLLELPSKILQLKFDYSSKQKDLAQLQLDMAEIRAKLADRIASPSDHDLKVEQLEGQAQLLNLQKQIAELEKQLRELAEK